MKTKTPQSRTTLHKLAKAVCLREQATAMFKEAEALEVELLDQLPANKEISLPDGRQVIVRDQFAEKNTIWKHTPVSRFKFEVVKE